MPPKLTDKELVETGKRLKTQFNFRLPSGQVIPAGFNPSRAATVDVAGTIFRPGSVFERGGPLPTIQDLTAREQGGTVPRELFERTLAELQGGAQAPELEGGAEVTGINEPGGQQKAVQAQQVSQQQGGPLPQQQVPETPAPAQDQQPQLPEVPQGQIQQDTTPQPLAVSGTLPQQQQQSQSQGINLGFDIPAEAANFTGASIVDFLNSIGQSSDFASRDRLAQRLGITNFTGTAQENTAMLNVLKSLAGVQRQSTPLQTQPSAPVDVPTPPQQPEINPQDILNNSLDSFGVDPNQFTQSFQQSPVTSVKDLVTDILTATGLPSATEQLEIIGKEIEDLENKRDDEIAGINDNPWLSEAQRSRRVIRAQEKFEGRINNRTNRLRLLQDTADDARQQAQFAARLAIDTFNANRNFEQNQLEFLFEQAERAAKLRGGTDLTGTSTDLRTFAALNPDVDITTPEGRSAFNSFVREQARLTRTGTGQGGFRQPTQSQFAAATFASRLQQSDQILERIEGSFIEASFGEIAARNRFFPDFLKGEDRRSLEQAQRNFVNALLRRESGASISPEEFNVAASQYFPQPGDTQVILEQKRSNRKLVTQGLINEAGDAFDPTLIERFGLKAPLTVSFAGAEVPVGSIVVNEEGRPGVINEDGSITLVQE